MDIILDDFEKNGTTREELFTLLEDIAQRTELVNFNLFDFNVLSYAGTSKKEPSNLHFFFLNEEEYKGQQIKTRVMNMKAFKKLYSDDIIAETLNGKTLLYDEIGNYKNNKMYLLSRFAYNTLFQKCDMGGTCIQDQTLVRDLYLSERLNSSKESISMLVRYNDCRKPKIFAFFSSRYTYIPQTIVSDIVKIIESENETAEIKSWRVTNRYVECFLEYPNKAVTIKDETLVPGIKICSSDTGYVSCTISSTWRAGNSVSIQESNDNRLRHVGEKDMDTDIRNIISKIFVEQDKFAELLLELSKKVIEETSAEGKQTAFLNRLVAIMKAVELDKILGAKRMRQFINYVAAEMKWNETLTAYDLCSIIMHLPEKITCKSTSTRNKLANGCGHAAYRIDY